MSTLLKTITWEDEFYNIMDSISTTYYDLIEYVGGVPEIVAKVESLANEVYEPYAFIYKNISAVRHPHVPFLDDVWVCYEEFIAEVISNAASLLAQNDPMYLDTARKLDEEEAYEDAERGIWEQYLNSGSNDMSSVFVALKSMRYNYLIASDSECYTVPELADNITLSVGDAQNILFNDLAFPAEEKFMQTVVAHYECQTPGTVMAIRSSSDDEPLAIGGNVKWN